MKAEKRTKFDTQASLQHKDELTDLNNCKMHLLYFLTSIVMLARRVYEFSLKIYN